MAEPRELILLHIAHARVCSEAWMQQNRTPSEEGTRLLLGIRRTSHSGSLFQQKENECRPQETPAKRETPPLG